MTTPQLLSSSQEPSGAAPALQQIEELVKRILVGRKVNSVTFVEELLALVLQVGEVHCSPVADRALCFELPDGTRLEVALDANRGKLRALCARLAVLCQEGRGDGSSGFQLYGGEGTIVRRAVKVDNSPLESGPIFYSLVWKARWTNTPGKHEFTITVAR